MQHEQQFQYEEKNTFVHVDVENELGPVPRRRSQSLPSEPGDLGVELGKPERDRPSGNVSISGTCDSDSTMELGTLKNENSQLRQDLDQEKLLREHWEARAKAAEKQLDAIRTDPNEFHRWRMEHNEKQKAKDEAVESERLKAFEPARPTEKVSASLNTKTDAAPLLSERTKTVTTKPRYQQQEYPRKTQDYRGKCKNSACYFLCTGVVDDYCCMLCQRNGSHGPKCEMKKVDRSLTDINYRPTVDIPWTSSSTSRPSRERERGQKLIMCDGRNGQVDVKSAVKGDELVAQFRREATKVAGARIDTVFLENKDLTFKMLVDILEVLGTARSVRSLRLYNNPAGSGGSISGLLWYVERIWDSINELHLTGMSWSASSVVEFLERFQDAGKVQERERRGRIKFVRLDKHDFTKDTIRRLRSYGKVKICDPKRCDRYICWHGGDVHILHFDDLYT